MPLKEDVKNTQTGSEVSSVESSDTNLSGLNKQENIPVENPSVQAPPIDSGTPPPTPPPNPPSEPNNWQGIYDYIKGSDGFSTELDYDSFVSKYSGDDVKMTDLFTRIAGDAINSGKESPFKSSTKQSFIDEEIGLLKSNTGGIKTITPENTPVVPEEAEIEGQEESTNSINPLNSLSNVGKAKKGMLPENRFGNRDVVNSIASSDKIDDESVNDLLKPLPNTEDPEAASMYEEQNLSTSLFDDGEEIIPTWDILGDQRKDINTGQPLNQRDMDQAELDKRQRWDDIKLDFNKAKDLADKWFQGFENRVANGDMEWEDLTYEKINKIITKNEKLEATINTDPKFYDYFYNTVSSLTNNASQIVQTRKNVEVRDDILSDFEGKRKNNPKLEEQIDTRFNGTSLEEVMLLDNRQINSFIQSYSAQGFNAADVKRALEFNISNYVRDNSKADMMNFRDQVKMQLDPNLSKDEKAQAFYDKYTEIQDSVGFKYLNDDQKTAAIINMKLRKLAESKDSWTLEETAEYQSLIDERSSFDNPTSLYDVETGELLEEGEATQKDIDFSKEVQQKKSIYSDTDIDRLYKRREELYFQHEWLKTNVSNKHKYVNTQQDVGFSNKSYDRSIEINYGGGKKGVFVIPEEAVRISDTGKVMEENMPYTYNMIKDIRVELTALNDLILFNQDPGSAERSGFTGSVLKGYNEYWMGEDEDHYTTKTRASIQALENSGFNITNAQRDMLVDNQWEKIGSAVGGSAAGMTEILFYSMVAKNVGGALGSLGRTADVISKLSMGNSRLKTVLTGVDKFMRSRGLYKAITSGAVYEAAGQGYGTGIGESAGQGMAEALFTKTFKKSFWNQFVLRLAGGTTGEVVQEYTGELLQHFSENGMDFGDAAEQTIGENGLEKLLHTYVISMMFSAPNSFIKTSQVYQLRRNIQQFGSNSGISQESIDEVLNMENEDGGLERRMREMMAAETSVSDVSKFNSLAKKDQDSLTDDEKVFMNDFQFRVEESFPLMAEDVRRAIQNTRKDLLDKETEEDLRKKNPEIFENVDDNLEPEVSGGEAPAFDMTQEEEVIEDKSPPEVGDIQTQGQKRFEKVEELPPEIGEGDERAKGVENEVVDVGITASQRKILTSQGFDKVDIDNLTQEEVDTSISESLSPLELEASRKADEQLKKNKEQKGVLSKDALESFSNKEEVKKDEGIKNKEGEKRVSDKNKQGESVNRKVRKSPNKVDSTKPVEKNKISKDDTSKITSLTDPDRVSVLKKELGMEDHGGKTGEAIRKEYMKRNGGTNPENISSFMKAVDTANGDVQTQEQLDIYASTQGKITKAEGLIKHGKTKEGEALIEEAKNDSSSLTDKADVAAIEKRIDSVLPKKIKPFSIKEKQEAEAKVIEDKRISDNKASEAGLEKARTDLMGTEVEGGEVLKVDRVSDSSNYEVLVKTGENTAVKADYNPETGDIKVRKENKTAQKRNFERNQNSIDSKLEDEVVDVRELQEEMESEVSTLSKDAGFTTKKGVIKAAIKNLIEKISLAKKGATNINEINKFRSTLNGLIKDDASIESLKLKRKLNNMMDSAIETDKDADVAVEPKKTEVKSKKGRKIKATGNPLLDNAKQKLSDIKANLDSTPAGQFQKDAKVGGDFYLIHIEKLRKNGDITEQQHLNLYHDFQSLREENKAIQQDKINAGEKAVEDALRKDDNEFNELDPQYQSSNPGIGSNPTGDSGRVQPRVISKTSKKSFFDKMVAIVTGSKEKDSPMTPRDMIAKLTDDLQVKLGFKTLKRAINPKFLGMFNGSQNLITLRRGTDLDTFIHEIGHKISLANGLLELTNDGSLDAELESLWIFGSPAPDTMFEKDAIQYRRNEGLAEFVRAYTLNPDVAKAKYPGLFQIVDSTLDQKTKDSLSSYGEDYSAWSQMTSDESMGINNPILTFLSDSGVFKGQETARKEGEKSFIDKKKEQMSSLLKSMTKNTDGTFSIGFWGRMNMAVVEQSGALRSVVKFTKKKGIEMANSADPYYLIRLMSNFQRNRAKNLIEQGLTDKLGQRVIDKETGSAMSYAWLYGALDTTNESALDKDIELVENYMIAQNIKWRREEQVRKMVEGGMSEEVALTKVKDVTSAGHGLSTNEAQRVEEILQAYEGLRSSNSEKFNAVEESARRYREFALQTMRYMRDTGRISDAHFKDVSKNQGNYVVLRAAMEQISDGVFDNFNSSNIKNPLDLKSRGEGSDVTRENPYSSLTSVMMESYYEADRNHAVRSYVEMLSDPKMLQGGSSGIRDSKTKIKGDVEVKYFVDGELETVWLDKDLALALENATKTTTPSRVADWFGKIFKDLPQGMITSTPAFAIKNLIRDKGHQIFVSRRRFNPVEDFKIIKPIAQDIKREASIYRLNVKKRQLEKKGEELSSDDAKILQDLELEKANSSASKLELYGGTMSGWYFKDRQNWYSLQNQVKNDLVKDGRTVFWRPSRFVNPKRAWKKWKGGVAGTEEVHRVNEFRAVYKSEYKKWNDKFLSEGDTKEEANLKANHEANIKAAFEAKDLMDFTVSGTAMADFNRLFMFLNPAIQGWNRTIKSFDRKGAGSYAALTMRVFIYSALPTIVEQFYNTDEEDEERAELPSYQKDMFWNFKLSDDLWYRVPKPFEFGMLSSGFTRAIDYQRGDENAFEGYGEGLSDMFVPVDGTSLLDNPFIQLLTGVDYFQDKDIVPRWEQDLGLELRDPKYSSELGKLFHSQGWVDARKFDHFMKKTFSNWGNMLLNSSDAILGDKSPEEIVSKRDLGVFSSSPMHTSRSYNAIREMQKEYGVQNRNPIMDDLNDLRDQYSSSTTSRKKDMIAKKFRSESKKVRSEMDDIIEKEGNLSSIGGTKSPEQKEEKEVNRRRSNRRSDKRGGQSRRR